MINKTGKRCYSRKETGGVNIAHYEIVEATPTRIVIRDLGPWDKYMTITNAAEEVIEELRTTHGPIGNRRVFYYDSAGALDELLVKTRSSPASNTARGYRNEPPGGNAGRQESPYRSRVHRR